VVREAEEELMIDLISDMTHENNCLPIYTEYEFVKIEDKWLF
jgi:hypothetical protein